MVQSHDIILHLMHPPKVPYQYRSDGTKKDAIRTHKVQKPTRSRQDLPRHHDPRNKRTDQLTPSNIDKGRKQRRQIVRSGKAIGRNIDPQRRQREAKGRKELTSPIRPLCNQIRRIPIQLSVMLLAGARARDADEGNKGKHNGQHGYVQPLPFHTGFGIAAKIRHVDAQGCVVSYDRCERGEPGVAVGAAVRGRFCGCGEKGTACAVRAAEGPDEHGDEADGDEDGFGDEEVAEVVGVHVEEGDLREPD